jgi:hypothetical protein
MHLAQRAASVCNAEIGVSRVNKIEALLDLGDIALNAVEAPADTHSLSVVPKAREPRLHVLHVVDHAVELQIYEAAKMFGFVRHAERLGVRCAACPECGLCQ